jgi:hypothetical protein
MVYNFASFVKESLAHSRLLLDIVLLGMFGGFYIVPLYTLIQTRCEKSHQSRVIAGNNILNALFMVASAILSVTFLKQGTIPQLFLAVSLINIIVIIYLCLRQPEYYLSFFAWLKA